MMAASILLKVTVIMALAIAGTRLARKSRAAVRHVLLAGAFVTVLILPIASIVAPSVNVAVPAAVQEAIEPFTTEPIADSGATTDSPIANQQIADSPIPRLPMGFRLSSWLLAGWMLGAAVFLLPVAAGLWQVRTLRRSARPWREGRAVLDTLSREAAIRRRMDILLHESLPGPITCGVLHPAIVLPIDAQAWTDDDLRRAIIHELEHVRRGDWISQCLARVVAACYWFHPIVWVAWRQLSLEAERACDDAVLRASEATAYADQLVLLAQRLSSAGSHPQLAMANRHDLATRVVAVLDAEQPRGRAGALCVGAAIAVTAVLAIGMSSIRIVSASTAAADAASVDTSAQTAADKKPKFDAATIKPCEAEEPPTGARGTAGGTNATFSPGRFFVPCVTIEQLIYLAYASYGAREDERLVNDDPGSASNAVKVRGGPAWVHSLRDKYTVEAVAEGATDRTVLMGAMLQSLLEDRFKLKLHRDTEEMSLYALTVAKSGFKLKPMKEGDCDPDAAPGPVAPGAKPKCGNLTMMTGDGKTRWSFGSGTMSGLAGQLSRALGIHVMDKTAIADKFVFRFEFGRGEDALATEASVFAALDEQLGLKLEKTKGPRGFLVIDHIERPSPEDPAPARSSPTPIQAAPASHAARFDVASVKPCAPNTPAGERRGGAGAAAAPGSLALDCARPVGLIYTAYLANDAKPAGHPLRAWPRSAGLDFTGNATDPQKIRGGPSWIYSERFTVEARAGFAADRPTMAGPMLRALLEDRFKLKVHEETEQVDMWALTVAPGGPKIKAPAAGDCLPVVAGQPPPFEALRADPQKLLCGVRIIAAAAAGAVRWNMSAQTVAQFIEIIADDLGQNVFDQTGLTGAFNFSFEYAIDENTPASPFTGRVGDKTSASPSIFTAVQEQLGLKLTRVKGPRAFIMIDSISRPTPDLPAVSAAHLINRAYVRPKPDGPVPSVVGAGLQPRANR